MLMEISAGSWLILKNKCVLIILFNKIWDIWFKYWRVLAYKLFFIALFFFRVTLAQEYCSESKFEDNCVGLAKAKFDNYIYVKSFVFSSENNPPLNGKVYLKRNILYVFTVCGGNRRSKVLNLYDDNNELVASSMDEKDNINSQFIAFTPTRAGKYSLFLSFEHKKAPCCLILLGMIKKKF